MSNSAEHGRQESLLHGHIDQVVLLATEIAGFTELSPDEIDTLYGDRLKVLAKRIGNISSNFRVVYSGVGYTPDTDYLGDPVTVHKKIHYGTGQLVGLKFCDQHELEYYEPFYSDDEVKDEYRDTIDDDEDNDGMEALIRDFESGLLPVPQSTRLLGEFLIQVNDEFETPIAGSSYLSTGVITIDHVDMSTIEVIDITPVDEDLPDVIPYERIGFALTDFANRYRKKIQNLKFRSLPVARQQKLLEKNVDNTNKLAGIDRFSVMVHGGRFYYAKNDSPEGFAKVSIDEEVHGRAMRIDCMELQKIQEGVPIRKRRGIVNSDESLCMVIEIDKETAEQHELKTCILWVPLINQADMFTLPLKYAV